MTLANKIRSYAYETFIRSALESGKAEIQIRAGDVHKDMGLKNRMPAVCGALDSRIFQTEFGLQLSRREGPRQGANAEFRFCRAKALAIGTRPKETTLYHQNEDKGSGRTQMKRQPQVTVYFVSCVSKKRPTRAPAKDLYASPWFQKARLYVEATGCQWFILSAEYGLVSPDEDILPYEKTLNEMSVTDRREWTANVIAQMARMIPGAKHVTILAGQRYREFLTERLKAQGITFEVPMEGLRIGEQLSWLSEHSVHG